MATAAAIAQFADRVEDCGGRFSFFVRIGLVLVRVAAGAIRFVGGEPPGDDFIVVGVATAAQNGGAVGDVANRDV